MSLILHETKCLSSNSNQMSLIIQDPFHSLYTKEQETRMVVWLISDRHSTAFEQDAALLISSFVFATYSAGKKHLEAMTKEAALQPKSKKAVICSTFLHFTGESRAQAVEKERNQIVPQNN